MATAIKFNSPQDDSAVKKAINNLNQLKGMSVISHDSENIVLDGYFDKAQISNAVKQAGIDNITIG